VAERAVKDDDLRYPALERLGRLIRRHQLRHFPRDSSIAATRVALDVLEAIKCPDAYPLSVQATIFNRALIRRALRDGFPESTEQFEEWHKEINAWGVGIGYPAKEERDHRWPGHLVAIVQRRFLWDLSIDQAERPRYRMFFPDPVILGVDENFLRGHTPLIAPWGDLVMIYVAKPYDKTFRELQHWAVEVRTLLGVDNPTKAILASLRNEVVDDVIGGVLRRLEREAWEETE
jgi:hypothetical protein